MSYDAGNAPEVAMPLAYGRYQANLTPGDTDWFVFPMNPTLGCLAVELISSHAMRGGIRIGASQTFVGDLANGVFATTIAIGAVAPRFAALPDAAPWDKASVGPYGFDISVATPNAVGDTDANDAPSASAGAPVAPATCFRGHFRESDTDVFRFAAHAADEVATVSLARAGTGSASVAIVDDAGQPVGDPIPAGEARQILLPGPDEYFLVVIGPPSPTSTDYLLTLVLGPEPTGCRPYCLQ